ncbi:hypothetical protein [Actinomadura sp. WMMA1423]|uniref:hypothetical protein n=1 Tax=Actinomadura sp. WMMA1423 TaxID=2591108 RepID=UPI001147A279|nr:hypothetical protein [Actinomadura sp. WMMA1423]
MKTIICALNGADADKAADALGIEPADRLHTHQLDRLADEPTVDVTVTGAFSRHPDAGQVWQQVRDAVQQVDDPPILPTHPPLVNAVYTTVVDPLTVDTLTALIEPFASRYGRTVPVADAARTFAVVLERQRVAYESALARAHAE